MADMKAMEYEPQGGLACLFHQHQTSRYPSFQCLLDVEGEVSEDWFEFVIE